MRSKRSTWKVLGLSATRKLGEIFWVIAICVLSEILIWCLSLALRLIDIQFLSAIVGMVMVFVFMLALSRFCDSTERFYMTRIKSKIDFINKNLGVGFPVPIVAISREESLGAKGIGKVIGNFPGFLVVLGIPVSVATGDNRILDGCMLWFVWVSAGKLQMALSDENLLSRTPRMPKAVMLVLTTLMNPVLITILLMMAYTRAKAAATSTPLFDLLGEFSSGTNLSDLWSHIVDQYRLNQHQPNHFGAGDGALAILECGIVVWGFKLYECRAQLASRAGLAVCIVSTVSAAINVFVSTLLAKAFGLAPPEALAFAARCTTLALARPAMDSLGGNQVINAALVVSNGIFGQLMYPFALKRLGIPADEPSSTNLETVDSNTDGARTIAAGTAIGINGAAMGVSYLYQQRSRAAPYSVLSMTVFGVMTVVFTGIQPSVKTLKALVA
ncbi:hypothetical protein ACHAQF_005063 [Verticillium nonalfalfae]